MYVRTLPPDLIMIPLFISFQFTEKWNFQKAKKSKKTQLI